MTMYHMLSTREDSESDLWGVRGIAVVVGVLNHRRVSTVQHQGRLLAHHHILAGKQGRLVCYTLFVSKFS